jgi:hypothetical protein
MPSRAIAAAPNRHLKTPGLSRTAGIARARRSLCILPWLPGSTRPSRGKKGRGPLPSSWQNAAKSAFGCPSGARSFRPACERLARYQSPAAPLTRGFVGGVPTKLPPERRNIPSWSAWWHPCNYAVRNYMGVIFPHRGQIRKRRFLILGSPAGLAGHSGRPTLRQPARRRRRVVFLVSRKSAST